MADKFVTHGAIAAHVSVDIGTAQRWGRRGLLGEPITNFPKLYPRSALKRAEDLKRKARERKVTDKQVAQIRKLAQTSTLTQTEIGERFGISASSVSQYVNNKRRVIA